MPRSSKPSAENLAVERRSLLRSVAKPKDPESYEIAGEPYRQHEDPIALLGQAAADYVTPDPSRNFRIKMQGERFTIQCMCYERGLGDYGRCQLQLQEMAKLTDAYLRELKKRYRELGGGALKVKELKDLRGFDRDMVSLNDRWMITYRRTYKFDDLTRVPEE